MDYIKQIMCSGQIRKIESQASSPNVHWLRVKDNNLIITSFSSRERGIKGRSLEGVTDHKKAVIASLPSYTLFRLLIPCLLCCPHPSIHPLTLLYHFLFFFSFEVYPFLVSYFHLFLYSSFIFEYFACTA